jgi:hypothetical protein
MKPALNRGLRKVGRDLAQVVAAGGATAVVAMLTGHLHPEVAVIVAFGFKLLVTFLQNTGETAGAIPVLLPSPGLITTSAGGLVGKAVGTVDAVTEGTGSVVGEVLNTAGKAVGGVAGAVGGLLGDVEDKGGV